MKDIFVKKRMWRRATLKDRYDVVVIGGGAHGLATAYYLAKNHGVKDVAVLEKSYIGAGRLRAQHDDHPLELPHPRGRGVLRAKREALRVALPGARLQHDVLAARASDARAL